MPVVVVGGVSAGYRQRFQWVPIKRLLGTILVMATVCLAAAGDGVVSHALWTEILRTHVIDGRVDYRAIQRDSGPLTRYLDGLAAVTRPEFQQWSEEDQIAFLLNLYNAATVKLVVDHYPVASIKKIGGLFRGPWAQKVARLFGEVTTLDAVEHEILRKEYERPTIHFGLVCGALGCPPLRHEAYEGSRLEAQLAEQGRLFLANPLKNRPDQKRGVLYLSPVFKWFEEDFGGSDRDVLAFVGTYVGAEVRDWIRTTEPKIRYTDYDWSLNEQETEE